MGITSLFGGGSAKQNPNTTVTNNPPDYAIPKLTDIAGLAQKAYQDYISKGFNQPYAGQRTAGINPFDQRSLDVAGGAAGNFLNSAPQDTFNLGKYYNDKVTSGGYNPQAAIEANSRPIIQDFLEKAAPRLTSQAITSGAYGGSKDQQFKNQAFRDTSQILSDTAAKTALDYGNQEMKASALVPTLANQGLEQSLKGADIYGNIGATQRGFEQQRLNDLISQFTELTSSPFGGLGEYAGLVQGAAGQYGSRTQYGYTQPGSNFLSGLGAASALPGLFNSGAAAATGLPWLSSGGAGGLGNSAAALFSLFA